MDKPGAPAAPADEADAYRVGARYQEILSTQAHRAAGLRHAWAFAKRTMPEHSPLDLEWYAAVVRGFDRRWIDQYGMRRLVFLAQYVQYGCHPDVEGDPGDYPVEVDDSFAHQRFVPFRDVQLAVLETLCSRWLAFRAAEVGVASDEAPQWGSWVLLPQPPLPPEVQEKIDRMRDLLRFSEAEGAQFYAYWLGGEVTLSGRNIPAPNGDTQTGQLVKEALQAWSGETTAEPANTNIVGLELYKAGRELRRLAGSILEARLAQAQLYLQIVNDRLYRERGHRDALDMFEKERLADGMDELAWNAAALQRFGEAMVEVHGLRRLAMLLEWVQLVRARAPGDDPSDYLLRGRSHDRPRRFAEVGIDRLEVSFLYPAYQVAGSRRRYLITDKDLGDGHFMVGTYLPHDLLLPQPALPPAALQTVRVLQGEVNAGFGDDAGTVFAFWRGGELQLGAEGPFSEPFGRLVRHLEGCLESRPELLRLTFPRDAKFVDGTFYTWSRHRLR